MRTPILKSKTKHSRTTFYTTTQEKRLMDYYLVIFPYVLNMIFVVQPDHSVT